MKLVLPDKLYTVLKYVAMVALPVIGSVYNALSEIWGLPFGSQILSTCSILAAGLGTAIGISTFNYNKTKMK